MSTDKTNALTVSDVLAELAKPATDDEVRESHWIAKRLGMGRALNRFIGDRIVRLCEAHHMDIPDDLIRDAK